MKNERIDFRSIAETEIGKIHKPIKSYEWENKEAYVDFISNMYYFLAQACRLLTAAASECGQDYDVFLSLSQEIGPAIYERCLTAHGKQATSYLRVHVEEDGDHIESLYEVLDQIPDSEAENVKESLLITSSLYKNFVTELCEKHSTVSVTQAA